VRKVGGDNPVECRDELTHALRGQVEPEKFDGNRRGAARIGRAEYGTQRPGADLMKNPKGSERVRWRGAGGFRVQMKVSSGKANSS